MNHSPRIRRLSKAAVVLVVCMLAQAVGMGTVLAAPPSVTGSSPANGEAGVTINQSGAQISFASNILEGPTTLASVTMAVYGGASLPISRALDGSFLNLTLSSGSLAYGTTYLVTVPAGAVKDQATQDPLPGPYAMTFTTEADTQGPALYDARIRADKLTLTYYDPQSGALANSLDAASVPPSASFVVMFGTTPVAVNSVEIQDSSKVVLTLAQAAANGQTGILVNYVPGATKIQDAAGNPGAGLTARSVTNATPSDLTPPQLLYAFVLASSPSRVYAYFNEAMAATGGSFQTGFTITVNGSPVTITSSGFNTNQLVEFETDRSIVSTDTVRLSYTGTDHATDSSENMLASISNAEVRNFSTGYQVPAVQMFPNLIRSTTSPVSFIVTGADMSVGYGELWVNFDSVGSQCSGSPTQYSDTDPDYAVFTATAHTFNQASLTVFTANIRRQVVSGVNIPVAVGTFNVSPTASAVQLSAPALTVDAADMPSIDLSWTNSLLYGGTGAVSYQVYRALNPKSAAEDPNNDYWETEQAVSGATTSPFTDNLTSLQAGYRQVRYMVQATYEGGAPIAGSPWSQAYSIPLPNLPGQLQFSTGSYTVAENGSSATITVTRTGGSSGSVSVNYATSNGTAVAGTDYTAASGTLTFAAGVTSQTFAVPVIDNTVVDGNRSVTLTLSNATGGATLGTSTATLTITDNDTPQRGALSFAVASSTVSEDVGTATVSVVRTGGSDGTVTVDYAVTGGTASPSGPSADFTLAPGTLTFANGVTSQTINIAIVNDTVQEGPETIEIALSNPTGGAVLGSSNTTMVVTIAASDLPYVTWTDTDPDHFYFDGNPIGFRINDVGLPNGTPVRVTLGVVGQGGQLDTAKAPLTGMTREGTSYYYVNATVSGTYLDVSGTINDPVSAPLSPGLLGAQIYLQAGPGWTPMGAVIPLDPAGTGNEGLVGISIPDGPVTMSPSFSQIGNLYNTAVSVTFTAQLPIGGTGSITFLPGLDLINSREQLQALQTGITMQGAADVMTGDVTYVLGVNTASLAFLASKGATISVQGLPAGFFNPEVIPGTGAGTPSGLTVNGDTLTFDVDHFSSYEIRGEVSPTWPQGASLTFSNVASDGVTFSWPAATGAGANAVTNYRLYRGPDLMATVDANTRSYQVTGLSASTQFTFRVQAGDAQGDWTTDGPSGTVTTAAGSVPVTGVTVSPTQLTLEVGQTAQLTATVAPANASNKTLEWGSADASIAEAVVDQSNTSGTVTAVAPGTINVGARWKQGTSIFGTCTVTVVEGEAPTWGGVGTSLTASSITSSGLILTWSNTASDNVAVTQYRVYRGTTLLGTVTSPTLTYPVAGLAASTEYTFKVEAGDASGRWSTTGPSVTAKTLAGGGGDSDSGGYNPPPAPKPDPVIQGNKADVTGSSTVTTSTKTDGTSTTIVTIDRSTIDRALAASSGVNHVVVKVTNAAQEVSTNLSAQSFTAMAEKKADLVVQTGKANLSIPPQVVDVQALTRSLNVTADQIQVKVSVQEVPASQADNLKSKIAILDENLKPVGSILQLNIEATAAGKSVKIDSFGDNQVTGEIPFTPSAVQGDVRKLCVYRFNETTGTWEPVPSRVDAATGKVTFFTNHFSNYTIMALEKTFSDLSGHWAKADIELMAARWVVKGDTATTYAPERKITRAQFAALLVRALGLTELAPASAAFSDVPATAWYRGSVEAAAAAGIVKGTDGGKFAPDLTITREEMAVMVARAMSVAKAPVQLTSDEAVRLLEAFSDKTAVDAWARDDLARTLKARIVQGTSSTTVAPLSEATRAEAATMVKRMMEKAGLL